MRFYYDLYTNRPRGELLLLGADVVAVVSAILFASGACYWDNAPWGAVFLGIWAVVPRCTARFFEWLQRPRDFSSAIFFSLLFVLFSGALVVIGCELLWQGDAATSTTVPLIQFAILLLWGSGFLLFVPKWYRIHDTLLTGVVLLALAERMPQPVLWVATFLFSLALSFATRHLLHDVFRGVARPPLNLQNARVAACVAALIAFVAFVGIFAALFPVLEGRESADGEKSTMSELLSAAVGLPETDVPEPADVPAAVSRSDARAGTRTFQRSEEGAADPEVRRVAFSNQVRLSDLRPPTYDPSIVYIVHQDRRGGRAPWRPSSGTLWKARAFNTFDPTAAAWIDDESQTAVAWPETGGVPMSARKNDDVTLIIEALQPRRVASLTAPYFPTELGPLMRTPRDELYWLGNNGDVYPEPPMLRGTLYWVHFRPLAVDITRLSPVNTAGRHEDDTTLEVPSEELVGVDLEEWAGDIFGDAKTISERLERLRRRFGRDYLYSDNAQWRGDANRLALFLEQEKVGDCVYFATAAALLLRAGGVSTRLVGGFLGGDWEETEELIVIRNQTAHSWLEVFVPDVGWLPVDPTRWVDRHPNYRPPQDLGDDPEDDPTAAAAGPEGDPTRPEDRNVDPATGRPTETVRREPAPPVGESGLDPETEERGENDFLRGRKFAIEDRLRRWEQSERESQEARAKAERLRLEQEIAARRSGETPATAFVEGSGEGGGDNDALGGLAKLALLLLAGSSMILALRSVFLGPRKEDEEEEEGDAALPPEPLGGPRIAMPDFVPDGPAEEILLIYHKLQLELSRTRTHRQRYETPVEHSLRFWSDDEDLNRAFRTTTESVYRAFYAQQPMTTENVDETRRACRIIRRHLTRA